MPAKLEHIVRSIAERARAASLVLATARTDAKNAALNRLADLIDVSHPALLEANRRDLDSAKAGGLGKAEISALRARGIVG